MPRMPQMNRRAARFATIVVDSADATKDRQIGQAEALKLEAEGKLRRVDVGEAWEPAYEPILRQ